MRKTILFVAIGVLVLAMPAMALASGWDDPALNPHGGYLNTTDYCKACHAVHEADDTADSFNGEKLLRSTTVGACDYCHVSGNFAAVAKVYGGAPANYTANDAFNHTLGASFQAPDSGDAAGTIDDGTNDYTFAPFGCVSCHSVHGAAAMAAFILKENPYAGDADVATNETEFCADCHDNNYVTVKDAVGGPDQVSHYMGDAVAGQSAETSADCRNCHDGGTSVSANSYPHRTTGVQFLDDNFDGAGAGTWELDGVCIKCHDEVGVTY